MTPPPGVAALQCAVKPYPDGLAHLWDELARVDLLVRAHTIRWRATVAAHKAESLWGMLTVSDGEVDTYLAAPFRPPGCQPPELAGALRPYLDEAERMATAIAARLRATPADVDLRFHRLCGRFDLVAVERDILLVCLLPKLESRYRRLYGYLCDDASRTRPSVELIAEILAPVHGSIRAELSAGSRLRRRGLVTLGPASAEGEPLNLAAVSPDPRIVNHLLGIDIVDDRLVDAAEWTAPAGATTDLAVPESVAAQLAAVATVWRQRRAAGAGMAALLYGPYGSGRRAAGEAICAGSGAPLLVVDAETAEGSGRGWEEMIRLAYREARLLAGAVLWTSCARIMETESLAPVWHRLVAAAEGYPGLTLFSAGRTWDPAGRFRHTPLIAVELPVPDFRLRKRIWETHLGNTAHGPVDPFPDDGARRAAMIEALADGFQLTPGQIADALATARALALRRSPGEPQPTLAEITEGCRRQSSRGLVSFARRIEPRPGMSIDDLILPATAKRQLQDLHNRIRYRNRMRSEYGLDWRMTLGKGTVALFAGSSGTGKTLAATLLASLHGVDLYKVDLSAVVSKYVGETEKNLEQLFKDAEDTNAIIFFDEADALFGKRGEVKEARDRWANFETNFLLQRIEEYAGVVILATNLRQHVDQAFMRRIHVLIEFPFPDARLRERIWQGLFPDGVRRPPAPQIRELAERFDLAGGSIKNIVLDATFRALADAPNGARKPTVTTRHIVASIARDQDKAGKPVTRSEFGEKFYAWIAEAGDG